jgi:hypothetical protein
MVGYPNKLWIEQRIQTINRIKETLLEERIIISSKIAEFDEELTVLNLLYKLNKKILNKG